MEPLERQKAKIDDFSRVASRKNTHDQLIAGIMRAKL